MTKQQAMDWLKQRQGFVAGAVVGLVATLTVIVVSFSGSSTSSSPTSDNNANADGGSSVAPPDPSSLEPGPSAAVSTISPTAVPASVAPVAAGPISLAGWKLTLPVGKGGSLTGKAKQLTKAAPTDPWLVQGADGSLTFFAPANGAKTSNSAHARTELVSTQDFKLGSGVHTLSALLSVDQVPAGAQDICVGQLHGGGALKSVPFVMLHWRNGNIVVIVKQEMHTTVSQSITLLTGVPLGARFSYAITDNGNGTINLTAAYNGQAQQATATVAKPFVGTDERFQAGDYQQATSGTSATDGGRATFYALTIS